MEGSSLLSLTLVYLAAGVISVPIVQRLGLGSVLGYLIAGAIIGPFALHLVGDQTDVMRFAEFGIVIMLFLIGLEVRPSILWGMRKAFFGLGAFLAGVVLAADSEFRHELEGDIEPFRGLLLGLFFISIGASMNLGLLISKPVALLALVAGLIVVKMAVIYVVARTFHVERRAAALTATALAQGGEFAFVLLGIASASGIVTADISALATSAVAISMALTPLMLIAYKRWCSGDLAKSPEPGNDAFDNHPDVIVAGFGRFGQIAARLLIVNRFKISTLDASAEQVDLVRRFGSRVYYGDATRLDLLRAAGAADAKVLIVAIDDRDQAEKLVEIAIRYFPNLKVLARAYDRRHAYRLLDKGAHVVERETFEAGLTLGAEALKTLGFKADQATRAARLFRTHDENMFRALAQDWGDEERYIVATKETSERMNELLAADIQTILRESDSDQA
ncbi:MAG: cation:proton antiporter [Burkholderiaceae bacterium]